jgi:hypothetical protein
MEFRNIFRSARCAHTWYYIYCSKFDRVTISLLNTTVVVDTTEVLKSNNYLIIYRDAQE